MHTVRTRRLLREICGPDTGSMTSMDRETVMPISLAIGLAVVVILAGCQQFAGKATAAAVSQPDVVAHVVADAHDDSTWISQAHAQAAKTGNNDSAPESY